MAEQSPEDVVKQEQSVDDLSSADVSATNTTESAARAVPKTSAEHHVDDKSTSSNSISLEQLERPENQASVAEHLVNHVNEDSSTITVCLCSTRH